MIARHRLGLCLKYILVSLVDPNVDVVDACSCCNWGIVAVRGVATRADLLISKL